MKFKNVSMFILLYFAVAVSEQVQAGGIPLSSEARKQIESIAASFSDYTSLADISGNRSGFLLGGDLYSLPSLQQVDVMKNRMPPLDGMPSIRYLSSFKFDDERALLWHVRGGLSIIRGIVVRDFAYSQGLVGGDVVFVQPVGHFICGMGVSAQYTSGDVSGSFLVEDERSHITFSDLVKGVRFVVGTRDYPIFGEAAFFATQSSTAVKLGEGGQPLQAKTNTPLGTGLAEYSLSSQWARYVVSVGVISDSYHSSFYRIGIYRFLD